MESAKADTCALHVHHRQICALPNNLDTFISLFGGGQTLTFDKHDPGPYQIMKYRICDVLGVHKYDFGRRVSNFSDLGLKYTFRTLQFNIH